MPAELPVLHGKGVAVEGALVGVRVAVCAAVPEISSSGTSVRQATVRMAIGMENDRDRKRRRFPASRPSARVLPVEASLPYVFGECTSSPQAQRNVSAIDTPCCRP